MFLSITWSIFLVPDFHRIHESYNTVFLGGTLYRSHKVFQRSHAVDRMAEYFIFATVAVTENRLRNHRQDRNLYGLIWLKSYFSLKILNNKNFEVRTTQKRARSHWSEHTKCKQLTWKICMIRNLRDQMIWLAWRGAIKHDNYCGTYRKSSI